MSVSKSRTRIKLQDIEPEEQTALDTLIELAIQQFDELLRSSGLREQANRISSTLQGEQQAGAEAGSDVFTAETLRQLFQEEVDTETAATSASNEARNLQLEQFRNGFVATPEQQALIDKASDEAIAAGTEDILNVQRKGIEQITREISPSLGLRPGDTPNQNRFSDVTRESVSQIGQLSSRVRSQQAEQGIQVGFQSAQALGEFGGLQESVRQFQNRLRQSRQANLQQLVAGPQGGGAILGIGSPAQSLSVAQNPRLAATTVGTFAGGFSTGAAVSAAGAGGSALSARSLKAFIERVDGEQVLRALEGLEVDRWKYDERLGDDREHIGPYAEDFRAGFGVGDGVRIEFMDAIGVLFAAVKELAKREAGRQEGGRSSWPT